MTNFCEHDDDVWASIQGKSFLAKSITIN